MDNFVCFQYYVCYILLFIWIVLKTYYLPINILLCYLIIYPLKSIFFIWNNKKNNDLYNDGAFIPFYKDEEIYVSIIICIYNTIFQQVKKETVSLLNILIVIY